MSIFIAKFKRQLRLMSINDLPCFDIDVVQWQKDFEHHLSFCRQQQVAITALPEPTWNNSIALLLDAEANLSNHISPLAHLNSVSDDADIRQTYDNALPEITNYHTETAQNTALLSLFKVLQKCTDLNAEQQRTLEVMIRDFKLAGVDLPETEKEIFKEASNQLAEVGNQFNTQLTDATGDWHFDLGDGGELAGIPATQLGYLKHPKNPQQFQLNLTGACVDLVLRQAQNRALRQQVYHAFSTRASDQAWHRPKWDNGPLIPELCQLKQKQARLLGFEHYSDYSLADKMAEPEQVVAFLHNLTDRARPKAEAEVSQIRSLAEEKDQITDVAAWDAGYYREQLQQQHYDFDQATLQEYFPLDHVLEALAWLLNSLYNITLKTPQWSGYADGVFAYALHDADAAEPFAHCVCDLFARSGKRNGAWMDSLQDRHVLADGHVQKPIALLVCNFQPATEEMPCLLTHDDLATLLHEMGHALQHMLTTVSVSTISGINQVPWDAVELPSQLMENFAWNKECLKRFSSHYQTAETLPDTLIESLLASKTFFAASFLMRQLEFGWFDWSLYSHDAPQSCTEVHQVLDRVRDKTCVLKPPKFNRFAEAFSHIFGGGYAAGYYSYLWAEMLSCDAFEAFLEDGTVSKKVGQRFRETVMALGGSQDFAETYRQFRGRDPVIEPLLKEYDLA